MKILQLISGRVATGAAAAALTDGQALRTAGHSVLVAGRKGAPLLDSARALGLEVAEGFRLGKGGARWLAAPLDARHLRRTIRDRGIDVVHVHRSDDQLLGWIALGRDMTTTLVRSWHRDPGTISKFAVGRLAAQVDGCVCVSRDHAETLRARGAKHAAYVPPAVDTALFAPPANPEKSIPVLGQVGRWKLEGDRDRGQRTALDVYAALPRAMEWKGVLLGRGEQESALRDEAYVVRKLPESRVEVRRMEKQSAAEFAAALGGFSLGLVFETGSDGTSRSAVEMLACGVPILVADRPGLRELADDSACARRLLADDPVGWAAAIEKLLAKPEEFAEMSAAARRRAEQVHTLAARGAALAEFYRSCV